MEVWDSYLVYCTFGVKDLIQLFSKSSWCIQIPVCEDRPGFISTICALFAGFITRIQACTGLK